MSNRGASRTNQIVTVDIDKELYQRLKAKASSKRYNTKEYINRTLKMLLEKEDFLQSIAPHLSVVSYNGNSVSLLDNRTGLVIVYMKSLRLFCDNDRTTDCIHTQYVWAIPELAHLNISEPTGKGKKKLLEILA